MLPLKAEYLSSFFILLWAALLFSPTVNTLPAVSIDVSIDGQRIGEMDILQPKNYNVKCRCAQNLQLNRHNLHGQHSESKMVVHPDEARLLRIRGGSEAAFASASLMASNPQMAKQFFGSNLISQPRKIGDPAFLPSFPSNLPDADRRQASP